MTLVIDTSRRTFACTNRRSEQTHTGPKITSTVPQSTNTFDITPSTCSINMPTICTSPPSSAARSTQSANLLSTIDEYLAELRLPLTTTATNTLRRHVPLKLDLDQSKLLLVEQALPSSPDALRRSHLPIPPLLPFDVANSSAQRTTDEIEDGAEEVVGSPAFYRCFRSGEGVMVMEDAAAFPYSPCRESVLVDVGGGDARSRVLNRYRDGNSRRDVSRVEMSEAGEQRTEMTGMPHVRFEAAVEEESSSSDDRCGLEGQLLHSSPSSMCSSLSSRGLEKNIDPVYLEEMQTRVPASDPANFTSISKSERPRRQRRCTPATDTANPATSAASSLPPRQVQPIETSPTSTQIVKGVRKLNKLKQLLGDEVGSHILPPLVGNASAANRVNTMKPLPLLPRRNAPQRSQTSTSAAKPRSKTCLLLAIASTGRPSTATGMPCTCAKCSRTMHVVSERTLSSSMAGMSLRDAPARRERMARVVEAERRLNASASVKAGSIWRDESFFEM